MEKLNSGNFTRRQQSAKRMHRKGKLVFAKIKPKKIKQAGNDKGSIASN